VRFRAIWAFGNICSCKIVRSTLDGQIDDLNAPLAPAAEHELHTGRQRRRRENESTEADIEALP
jgi:hypothetical protein